MEDEVIKILRDEMDEGERLNALVDEFRLGRDVRDLVPLLESDDSELTSIGVWVFSELPDELYGSEELVAKLRGLTGHVKPMVRFYALSAIFPFLGCADAATRALLDKLMRDENEGVRRIAEAAAERLSR